MIGLRQEAQEADALAKKANQLTRELVRSINEELNLVSDLLAAAHRKGGAQSVRFPVPRGVRFFFLLSSWVHFSVFFKS